MKLIEMADASSGIAAIRSTFGDESAAEAPAGASESSATAHATPRQILEIEAPGLMSEDDRARPDTGSVERLEHEGYPGPFVHIQTARIRDPQPRHTEVAFDAASLRQHAAGQNRLKGAGVRRCDLDHRIAREWEARGEQAGLQAARAARAGATRGGLACSSRRARVDEPIRQQA